MLLSINMWKVRSSHIFLLNNFIILFIFSCDGSLRRHRLFSPCGARASHSSGFSCWGAQSLECGGFRSRGSRPLEHRLAGLDAVPHVGSSQIRDRTCVSCTGSWLLGHWATREAFFWISWIYRLFGIEWPLSGYWLLFLIALNSSSHNLTPWADICVLSALSIIKYPANVMVCSDAKANLCSGFLALKWRKGLPWWSSG